MRNEFIAKGIFPKGNVAQQKVVCPNCALIGKKKTNDTPLSINLVTGLFNCHKCGWHGCVATQERKEYKLPIKTNFTKIGDKALSFFTGRGITQEVVIANKIVQEGDWVIFPYLRQELLVNVKKRALATKDFRQGVECEAIMYNYDRVFGQKEVIICEGEMDCMSFEVAGFTNVTSVNQGAPNEKDKNIDKKLECITNCFELFESAETIYLAVDKDANGQRLEQELIRRFSAEKCKVINFPNDRKDANDVLIHDGKDVLIKCFKEAKDVKVSGIYTVSDVSETMITTFKNGKKRGTTTYFSELDPIWTHRTGEVTIWTGYMNEGKSTFVKQLLLLKAVFDGEKVGVFSPEEYPPDEFYDDLIHTYIGKSTDRQYGNVMSETEYIRGQEFTNNHFFYVYPEDNFSWEEVARKMDYLVMRYGIRTLLLDPFNQFDHHQEGMMIDMYISKFMSKLKAFASSRGVSIHLIAHQVTPVFISGQDYPRPDAYKIKGGGTFSDKADNVGWIWQPFRITNKTDKSVIVHVGKVKKKRLTGTGGGLTFTFNIDTNRYHLGNTSPFESNVPIQASLVANEAFLVEKKSQEAQPITAREYATDDKSYDLEGNEIMPVI